MHYHPIFCQEFSLIFLIQYIQYVLPIKESGDRFRIELTQRHTSASGEIKEVIHAVYYLALKQPTSGSLVVTHRTAEVHVTSDRTTTLGLVPVELSSSISGSHATTYTVNTYVSQICIYLR